jgi:hypothetical protein
MMPDTDAARVADETRDAIRRVTLTCDMCDVTGKAPETTRHLRLVLAALTAAEQERDKAIERREDCHAWHREAERERNQLRMRLRTAERKIARLATLEAAAREIAVLWPSDPKLWAWEEVEALVNAVAALTPAREETSVEDQ